MADNARFRNNRKPEHPVTDPTGKLPPHDSDLEEAVLGALMLEKDAYMNVCDTLVPESFYDPVNQMIYEAIQQLGLNQRPIDMITVTDQLAKNGNLEKVGGNRALGGAPLPAREGQLASRLWPRRF